MKRYYNRLLTLLMAVIMIMAFSIFVNADMELATDYTGKTVILSSNDVHGAVDGYAYMKALETELEARGADVIIVDAGDFSQGTTYVSESKGASAIEMMNLVGYDYSTLGNHEFDYGPAAMAKNIEAADFDFLCADLLDKETGEFKYMPSDIYEDEESGLKIGFFGMATPETQTKSIPTNFEKIKFPSREEIYPMAQGVIDQLKTDGADVIVCLAHLGVDAESEPYRSVDLAANTTGIDIILDGHSHTVMENGDDGEAIMSTGTEFMNIGVTVINEETKAIETWGLYKLREKDDAEYAVNLTPDPEVKAAADELVAEIDAAFSAKIAESKVDLNGEKGTVDGVYGNRNGETNSGDLITDAMKWYVMKDGTDLGVPAKNVVTITNGGGIRAWIKAGDVSMKSINTVLPFGNTIAAVTVKGSELLEALEASTYAVPGTVGGFPQIEGMNITIKAYETYDANAETYPDSTYYGPASINRVKINDVNGEAFDPEATYVVLTNNFCAVGGDTYYAFVNASSQFDTGIALDYAVREYVVEQLGGVIDETYAEPQGRITILTAPTPETVNDAISELPDAVSSDDAKAINHAKELYDSLSDEDKAALPAGAKEKLEAAEAKLDAAVAKDAQKVAEEKTDSIAKLAADVVDAAASGLSAGKYTKASYDAYKAAIEAAAAALKNADATKEDFDAADAALLKAKDELTLKAEQPMSAKGKTINLKAKNVKKKAATITAKKAYTVKNNQGTVTYKKTKGNSKITVAKNGKITVKKGLKKGTYKITIKATAAGNDNYLSGSKTVKVTIKIK